MSVFAASADTNWSQIKDLSRMISCLLAFW